MKRLLKGGRVVDPANGIDGVRDVLVDGDRIYGEGVNVAARLQALAEPGGTCISGTVFDQVENKLRLPYEPLGEHTVKNIARPLRVYRIRAGVTGEPRGTTPHLAAAAPIRTPSPKASPKTSSPTSRRYHSFP